MPARLGQHHGRGVGDVVDVDERLGDLPAGRASSPAMSGAWNSPRRSSGRSWTVEEWSTPAPSHARPPLRNACPARTWSRPSSRRRARTAAPGAAPRRARPWRRTCVLGRSRAGAPRRRRRPPAGPHPSRWDRTSRSGSGWTGRQHARVRRVTATGQDPSAGLARSAEDECGVVGHAIIERRPLG